MLMWIFLKALRRLAAVCKCKTLPASVRSRALYHSEEKKSTVRPKDLPEKERAINRYPYRSYAPKHLKVLRGIVFACYDRSYREDLYFLNSLIHFLCL